MPNPMLRRLTLTAASLLLAATAASAATLKEPFSQSYPFNAGATLTLRNVNGAVTLEGWDRNDVRVDAEKEVKAGSDEAARKLMSEVKIEVQASAGGVHIETRIPQRDNGFLDWLSGNQANVNVTYHIHLPRRAVVDAGNTNGRIALTGTQGKAKLATTNGGLDVAGVQGDLVLETTNGAISGKGVSGTVKAETTNGGIDLLFASVPRAGDLSLETTNGAVTVKLPRGAAFSVDAENTNGGVQSDFEIAGDKGKHHMNGTVNGGGSRLRIRTTNGGVHLAEV